MSQDFSVSALSALGWKPFFLSSLNLAELEQFTLGACRTLSRN